MPLFVAVVPPQWQMWGYNPKNFLLASLAVIFVPPLLKLWRRPCLETPNINYFILKHRADLLVVDVMLLITLETEEHE